MFSNLHFLHTVPIDQEPMVEFVPEDTTFTAAEDVGTKSLKLTRTGTGNTCTYVGKSGVMREVKCI